MNLSAVDLRPFWRGVISLTEEDGGVCPERVTARQLKVCAESGTFIIRAGASAGCCLAMRTDAEAFSFDYRLSPGSTRDFYSFDLWVNGSLLRSVPGLMSKKTQGTISFSLPEGERSLCLYLPNLQRTQLFNVELNGASFAQPLPADRRLLCLGDSITQGFLARIHSGCYAGALARLLGAELLNQGIGAECYHAETLDEELPFRPDLVTIAYGTNDWSTRTPDVFLREAERYLKKAARIFSGARIAVLTPLPRLDEDKHPDWPLPEARKALEEIIRGIPDLLPIRGENLMPRDASLLEDHVHPNDRGFEVMTKNLFAALPGEWKR